MKILINANALHIPLADDVVQCVVTSPPYWALRDYGVSGQLGLEKTPDCLGWATGHPCGACYVCQIVAVFREVKRVLREDGVMFLNLGDSYGTGTTAVRAQGKRGIGANTQGAQDAVGRCGGMAKQLIGIPWRVALALQADGWYLRSDIIWAKPNPMPESVTDRPTKSHEYIFLLTKSARYVWDQEEVKEENNTTNEKWGKNVVTKTAQAQGDGRHGKTGFMGGEISNKETIERYYTNGRNIRTVWTIATQPTKEAHFATFPEALAERCIKAGSKAGDVVFDPFTGSGTTARVSIKLNRRFAGTELNFKYLADIANVRTSELQPEMIS